MEWGGATLGIIVLHVNYGTDTHQISALKLLVYAHRQSVIGFRQDLAFAPCPSDVLRLPLLHFTLAIRILVRGVMLEGFFSPWRNNLQWAKAISLSRIHDHAQRRTTVGSTPLDE